MTGKVRGFFSIFPLKNQKKEKKCQKKSLVHTMYPEGKIALM